jgi:hypothetical protein
MLFLLLLAALIHFNQPYHVIRLPSTSQDRDGSREPRYSMGPENLWSAHRLVILGKGLEHYQQVLFYTQPPLL